ncbi:BTAD domain-containing putative transcriptional regulator [Candidatus Chlorohelix sp.]|uniref:AfsR/SARP family transcriptional regulator n=1 Tax=Candidatus Chlorohelix sp. TaxID=3139201 RepID=UPI00301E6946
MTVLQVYLFGRLRVENNNCELEGFEARKLQELLSYLLLNRDRPLQREALATLLWPDLPGVPAKKNLRQTLWQLQNVLTASDESAALLVVEPEWVLLNSNEGLWLDVGVFEEVYTFVQGMKGHELDLTRARFMEEALRLYQSDLLEGWYGDWCLNERERLHNIYLAMMDKLMDYCEAHSIYEKGISYGLRILCHDRTRERTHQRLMKLHYLTGDRGAAMRQYQRCALVLEEELGIKPSRRTYQLYQQIRADSLIPIPETNDNPSQFGILQLPEVINHLRQLQALLSGIDDQLKVGIEKMEQSLKQLPTRGQNEIV